MIDFPALVQGLFLLLMLALVIATVIFFRKPGSKKFLSQEKRAVLLFATLGILLLLTVFVSGKVDAWKLKYRQQQENQRLQQKLNKNEFQFIERSFKPMGKAYMNLRASGTGLDKIISKINGIIEKHPNHHDILERMLHSFVEARKTQRELYKKVNLEVRNAMLQSATTQDELSVHNHFHNRAAILHQQMFTFDKDVKKRLNNAAWLLEGDLKAARKKLTEAIHFIHKAKKSKKQSKITVYDFGKPPETERTLLQFLQQTDAATKQVVNELASQIILTQQSKDKLFNLVKQEKELVEPINKTIRLWDSAETQGLYYWGVVFYALESAYLADQFNMPHHNRSYYYLVRDLKKLVPEYLAEVKQTNKDAKSSFFPLNYAEKAR